MDENSYDLVGHPDDGYRADPSGATAAAVPLDYDLPCRHCGYNLRGLDESRACPECGTAVGRSLLGDQLRFSDPQWVATLARGANWILWGVLINLLLTVVGFFVGIGFGASGGNPASAEQLMGILSVLPAVMFAFGVWLITSPEPGVIEQSNVQLRNLLRFSVLFTCVVTLLSVGITGASDLVTGIVGVISGIVWLIGHFGLFVYARRLALRVPDYELAKQTKTVMWGVAICMIGFLVFGILAVIVGIATSGTGFAVMAIPLCVLSVAYLVFMIWSLVLLFRYRRVSLAAADEARRTWAVGT